MEPEIKENLNSEIEETDIIVDENDDADALKEKFERISNTNKQLFERAKKAEIEAKELKQFKADIEAKKEPEKNKSGEIDYAQEAYLIANGIKEADEIELVKNRMIGSGVSLKEIIGNKYFQEELKDLRDGNLAKMALPSNSKRANPSARDTVEYWRAKIESGAATLLDVEDVKLRRQIINSKISSIKDVNHFTDNPFGDLTIPLGKNSMVK